MKTKTLLFTLFAFVSISNAQDKDSESSTYQNIADQLVSSNQKLSIGGYGEAHYNQFLSNETRNNGILDVHRMVMFLAYNFSNKTHFVSEIEFEHINEAAVEQLFLQHSLNDYINFKAGLMLVPMGIINEYHEPTSFNGVERPMIDNKIAPSTWRELGAGFSGNILPLSLKYQVYIMNGPSSYSTTGLFSGSDGYRKGRQQGSESYISSPNYTAKIEHYGIRGLNMGLSGYFGKSQSALYDKIKYNESAKIAKADSSVVGISMLGFDTRYSRKGLEVRGQFYYSSISNTEQYNTLTNKDLGSSMIGYYIEAGYNVLRLIPVTKMELFPFVRYQAYDTQLTVTGNTVDAGKNDVAIITTGLSLKLTKGAVLKADVDFAKSKADASYSTTLNAGLGIMF